jgi:2-keto-4-pentenoate hydratase/2-oxohepta-3-ene-1,7-dioic acid hydratase in catechol pathway
MFTIDDIIAFVSQYFTLRVGDLIFTGTPKGVGKWKKMIFLKLILKEKSS